MRNIAHIAIHSLATLLLQTVFLVVMVESLSVVPVHRVAEEQQRHHLHNRREVIAKTLLTSSALLLPTPTTFVATAAEPDGGNGKPFAPLEALLPATRLKIWVDEIYVLSKDLSTAKTTNHETLLLLLKQMVDKLSHPPKLFQGETIPKRTNNPTTAQLTTSISSANKEQYQMNRNGLNLSDKVIAAWNQADVERQWGMLQYAESKREEGNEMRAAFNFYTRQLTFADEYLLTAPKEMRKEMIRNDALPSITAVIASDLDRRDLYRNQFLTAIDDAVAEVAYQARQKPEEIDVNDVTTLVNEAHEACENWFSLIPSRDVEEAIAAVTLKDAK